MGESRKAVLGLAIMLVLTSSAFAAGRRSSSSYHSYRVSHYSSARSGRSNSSPSSHRGSSGLRRSSIYGLHHSRRSTRAVRDRHGRVARSRTARAEFMRSHPCPSTGKRSGACPGYVVDHRKALACGGADSQENMQWQTNAEGKAKDKWERNGCR